MLEIPSFRQDLLGNNTVFTLSVILEFSPPMIPAMPISFSASVKMRRWEAMRWKRWGCGIPYSNMRLLPTV